MPTTVYPGRIDEFSIPYVPAASVTESRLHIKSGQNALMNLGGWLSRRPGFVKYASNSIAGTINNIFVYRRWNATTYIMLSVATATDSIVYKLQVGVDTQFSSLVTTTGSTARWDFDVSGDVLYFCNGTDNKKWDGTTVTKWGIAKGAAAPAASQSAGALTSSQGGWSWAYCFGNSTTGHIGARSPASAFTGNVSSQRFTITGSDSSDAQVNRVHIFRTKDGGGTYYEVSGSPITYVASWSFIDNTADSTLSTTSIAPLFQQNDPPPASKGVTFHAGRLWVYSGSYVYYSVVEEGNNGVDAENFPTSNKYDFGVEITKLVRVGKALLIFTRSSIWRILGDTLDTFIRAPFINSYGTPGLATCTNSGKIVGFLETAGSIVVTDAASFLRTLSLAIDPDISGISQSNASVVFHREGKRGWFIIQDAAANKMWVFDLQIGFWNVPWTFGGTAIWSGEISAGASRLLVAKNGYVYYLDPAVFSDDGTGYTCKIQTGLIPLVPPQSDPDWVGSLEYVNLRTNSIEPSTVAYLIDDDPATATYTSVAASDKFKRPERTQGANLLEKNYKVMKSGIAASLQINWDNSTTEWKLFGGALVPQGEITSA